jgi:light-regulated signal transduction histidine kinase (bacteriophytochrome)
MNIQTVKLEKSNLLLSEINEDLETFTYSVSHDLKAPLRGIDGYSQLLAESIGDDLDEESKIFLANIRSSSQQMNLLIEDLLAYSRLERKGFIHEPLKLTYIMDDILRQYQSEIETHKIKISRNCPENFILNTDKESLLIVIRNLIDNAIKFSAKEEKPTIEIGSSQSDTEFIIFVQDNGIGFDMKYHSRIFKIFQRLHLAEEYQGTGIGLAMVSKAVQRMNGQISAESSPGNGACFTLRIRK